MAPLPTFEGHFKLDRPLKPTQVAYLVKFSDMRHVKRDVKVLGGLSDPLRETVGLPLGPDGAYYVSDNGEGWNNPSVLDINQPPEGQPSLYCEWMPTADGAAIVWDGADKFYEPAEWLEYLIEHFLKPWGHILNGEVHWDTKRDYLWPERDTEPVICNTHRLIAVNNNKVRVRILAIDVIQDSEE